MRPNGLLMHQSSQVVESIIGVLMCGLSASFLFAIVTRLVEREAPVSDTPVTEPISTPKDLQRSSA